MILRGPKTSNPPRRHFECCQESNCKKLFCSFFFQGDRTELVTAPKGRRGCVTYLDFSSETISAEPEPAKFEPLNSTIEDEILVS